MFDLKRKEFFSLCPFLSASSMAFNTAQEESLRLLILTDVLEELAVVPQGINKVRVCF